MRSHCLRQEALHHAWRIAFVTVIVLIQSISGAFAEDRRAEIKGLDMNGFGRLVLHTSRLPKSDVAIRNGVLVWTFDRALEMRVDKIPIELSTYVAGARLDPDGKTLRLALTQNLRFHLQDAGDDLYLDLLPKSWTAANPPIPEDIVRDLSRRVREAEAQLRANAAAQDRFLTFEGGEGGDLALVRISTLSADKVVIKTDGASLSLRLLGQYRIDKTKLTSVLPRNASLVDVETGRDDVTVRIAHDPMEIIRYHFDDAVLVIEFHKNKSGIKEPSDPSAHQKKGEITGSTDGSHDLAQNQSSGLDEQDLRLADDSGAPVLVLPVGSETPLGVFSVDHFVHVVFRSGKALDWNKIAVGDGKAVRSVRSLDSGEFKGVAIGFDEAVMPVISKTAFGYRIAFAALSQNSVQSFDYLPLSDIRDQARLVVAMPDAADIIPVDDPETGARYDVVPGLSANIGMREKKIFQEFHIERSSQGLAVRKLADDLTLNADAGALIISRLGGLRGLTPDETVNPSILSSTKSILRAQNYALDRESDPLLTLRDLSDRIIVADPKARFALRVRLARTYASQNLYREAAASMQQAFSERVSNPPQVNEELEFLIYQSLSGEHDIAHMRLSARDMIAFPDASLMSAYHHAKRGAMMEAVAAYRASGSVLASYPTMMMRRILPVLAEAAIEAQDVALAGNLVASMPSYVTDEMRDMYRYLSARYLGLTGQTQEANTILEGLVESPDRAVATRARLAALRSDHTDAPEELAKRIAAYQGLETVWRGDWIEAAIVMELAKLSFQVDDWRRGFMSMQTLNRSFSDYPGVRALLDTATLRLESIFDESQTRPISAIEAVALFMDFREFMPVGRRGDEVIRKLSEKLEALDLLPQAAELVRYQINNRMEPSARAASAPRLAYLYVLDRRPQEALAILNDTRMNGIPDALHHARLLLEARARADLGDHAGAFELVEALDGEDVDRLRAELAWRAKDWSKAAEMSELVIAQAWQDPALFDEDLASYAMRSAIGYTLAKDRLSLDRIRGRFLKKFGDRPDAAAFRFLTAPTAKSSPFESEYALSYKGGSTIDGFMRFYREHYLKPPAQQSDAGVTP